MQGFSGPGIGTQGSHQQQDQSGRGNQPDGMSLPYISELPDAIQYRQSEQQVTHFTPESLPEKQHQQQGATTHKYKNYHVGQVPGANPFMTCKPDKQPDCPGEECQYDNRVEVA